MSLAEAILKQKRIKQKQAEKGEQQPNSKTQEFDYIIISRGGESVLVFKDKGGKKREVAISVHTPIITYPTKYKWHVRNAFGNRIFIKVQKRELAQEVIDYLTGEKGKYKVSASSVD